MASLTNKLKKLLWERFGSADYPAEWDGRVYGGGKISQRWWEYFQAIEYLELHEGAVVLDIGGGSPATGLSFFPRLLAACDVRVIVLDTNFGDTPQVPANVTLIHGLADFETLTEVLQAHRPTHISCVSVLEHASAEQQLGIFKAVETEFHGEHFVCTLEFHEKSKLMDNQLTTATLSTIVSPLTRYFLQDIAASPLNAVDAFQGEVRLWYPLALQFSKA